MNRTTVFLAIIGLTSAPGFAASSTATLNISSSVAAVCTITTSAVAFGNYDPVVTNATANLSSTGTVTVACAKGTAATIDLGNGTNFTAGSRRMQGGSDFLTYALYKDAAPHATMG